MSEITLFNVVALSQGRSVLAECQGSYQPTCEREDVLLNGYLDSLTDMGTEERLAHPQQRISAMLTALEQTPHLKAQIESSQGEPWSGLQQETASLLGETDAHSDTTMGKMLESRLRQAVANGHKDLAEQEIQTTGQAMKEALATLGYEVEQKGQATRATRKGTTIWTQVGAKGQVTVDVSGITGLSCTAKVQELGEELRRRGVTLERRQITRHNDVKGGELAQALRAELPEPTPGPRTLGLSILKRRKVRRRRKIRQ